MERRPITIAERIAARIEQRGSCWVWLGPTDKSGHPVFTFSARLYYITTLLWVQEYGPVPDGLVLTCTHQRTTVSQCVNPAHYAPTRRTSGAKRCDWGHDLTDPMNIAWARGKRYCLACIHNQSLSLGQERKPTPKRKRTS